MNKKLPKIRVAVCIASDVRADLQLPKLYRILADRRAANLDCLRVVDDSGQDYLYPASRFVLLKLPQPVQKQLLAVINADAA